MSITVNEVTKLEKITIVFLDNDFVAVDVEHKTKLVNADTGAVIVCALKHYEAIPWTDQVRIETVFGSEMKAKIETLIKDQMPNVKTVKEDPVLPGTVSKK